MRDLLATFAVFFVSVVNAGDRVLSHPPLRTVPPPVERAVPKGPVFYVDPLRGDDSTPGNKETPWKTLAHATTQLRSGMTLLLRGGVYYEPLTLCVAGRADAPITVASHPGEQAIIDGGFREFFDAPARMWEPCPGGAAGEFRSRKLYPNLRNVYGWFGDSMIGLHTYYHLTDLRAANELWDFIDVAGKSDVKPLYCGPGLWYDAATGRIHCRLAHTHLPSPARGEAPLLPSPPWGEGSGVRGGQPGNYTGETDPRKLPLVIAPFRSVPLRLDGAKHVRIHDLVLRGGGYDTVILEQTHNIELDNLTIWSGSYGLRATGAQQLKVARCGFYGSVPPWTFRTDSSLRSYPERGQRDIVRYGTHAHLVQDAGREFSVYAFPINDDWEIAHCEFTDAHDGVYLGGVNVRFHHNRVHDLQDDGLYLSPMSTRYGKRTAEVRVYQNYIGKCLTALAFGGPEELNNDVAYIYRNVIDLRHPLRTGRPSTKNPQGGASTGKVMGDHGSPPWSAMRIYHNTCVMAGASRSADMGFLDACTPERPRQVFNNLHVHLAKLPLISGPAPEAAIYDGNLYWSPGIDAKQAAKAFAKFRASPLVEAGKKLYPPGLHNASRIGDPRFAGEKSVELIDAFRLGKGSAARGAGVDLPAAFPDSEQNGSRDIGAISEGARWRTGRR
jgi:hypothetical protein